MLSLNSHHGVERVQRDIWIEIIEKFPISNWKNRT